MSKNDSNPLRRITKPVEQRLDSDTFKLEEAYEAARDARDIIRDAQRREQRSLQDYAAGEDEDTARHEMHVHVHQHAPQPSSPEIEVETSIEIGPLKAKGLPRWATAAVIGIGVVAAVATAIASHFAAK